MVRFLILIGLSIPIIVVSRKVVLKPGSHGFYRFLSWECILWLLINNTPYWFTNPFGLHQIVAWILLIYSLLLIVPGVNMMKKASKLKSRKEDNSLYDFEKTSKLIQTGIFKYIRHPLYGSLLFLTWGIYFKNPVLELIPFAALSTVFLIITVKIEERENILFFGEEYKEYMKKSKMFFPYLF